MPRPEDLHTPGGIEVPSSALSWRFSRAGGPGGQHVNTADSRVELLCDLSQLAVDDDLRERLVAALGDQVRIVAASERSQWRNRQKALERLATRIDRASHRPPVRRATKVSRRAAEQRLQEKRQLSERKQARRWAPDE